MAFELLFFVDESIVRELFIGIEAARCQSIAIQQTAGFGVIYLLIPWT